MKKQVRALLLSSLAFLAVTLPVSAQDQITLINGDEFGGKFIKQSATTLTYIDDAGIESDIDRQFVSRVKLATGKSIEFTVGRSMGFEYDSDLVILKNSPSLETNFQQIFRNSIRREFRILSDNLRNEITDQLFMTSTDRDKTQLSKEQKRVSRILRYFAYVTNAFVALVNTSGNETKVVFYSKSIDKATIESYLLNKTFRLVDSNALSSLVDMLEEKFMFTMKFVSPGICIFQEENKKPETLNYEVDHNGRIAFWEGAKKNRATTYEIVYIDQSVMRYTRFLKGADQDVITRKVQVIN